MAWTLWTVALVPLKLASCYAILQPRASDVLVSIVKYLINRI